MSVVRGSGTRVAVAGLLAMAVVAFARLGHAATSDEDAQLIREAHHTVDVYRAADPGINEFFRRSVGYVVFPGIGKGGLGIGGAHGTGVLFERGAPVGKVTMNQVTVEAQAGGQEFSQIVFFEVHQTLNDLKAGKASLSAEDSAVALSSGAAAKWRFKTAVAVFTTTKGGPMLEASVGGQKFKFSPFAMTR